MPTAKPKIVASATSITKSRKPTVVKQKTASLPVSSKAQVQPKDPVAQMVKPKTTVKSKVPQKSVDTKPAVARKAVKAVKVETSPAVVEKDSKKQKKAKVIRDSFTMPEIDYTKLAMLKKKCLAAGVSVKKSELLRAGVNMLESLPIAKLKLVLGALVDVKTGRPSSR